MLVASSVVFLYYTLWVFVIVSIPPHALLSLSSPQLPQISRASLTINLPTPKPFVDDDHVLHTLFPPRVWAIRIPVLLVLVASAVVGSFVGMVMIRSNRKKAAKAKAAVAAKKAT
jgi:dolichyl-phosphate mannosyltransferase polypeptide 2 regulatory subunit